MENGKLVARRKAFKRDAAYRLNIPINALQWTTGNSTLSSQ
jgi:hypothetical protein